MDIEEAVALIRVKRELDRRGKRVRVIEALKNYFCEIDELADQTHVSRKDIKRVLAVLIRARLVVVKWREHHLNPDGKHGMPVYFWRESESVIDK